MIRNIVDIGMPNGNSSILWNWKSTKIEETSLDKEKSFIFVHDGKTGYYKRTCCYTKIQLLACIFMLFIFHDKFLYCNMSSSRHKSTIKKKCRYFMKPRKYRFFSEYLYFPSCISSTENWYWQNSNHVPELKVMNKKE